MFVVLWLLFHLSIPRLITNFQPINAKCLSLTTTPIWSTVDPFGHEALRPTLHPTPPLLHSPTSTLHPWWLYISARWYVTMTTAWPCSNGVIHLKHLKAQAHCGRRGPSFPKWFVKFVVRASNSFHTVSRKRCCITNVVKTLVANEGSRGTRGSVPLFPLALDLSPRIAKKVPILC